MIEATCAACGTVNRIAENDLPPWARSSSRARAASRASRCRRTPSSARPLHRRVDRRARRSRRHRPAAIAATSSTSPISGAEATRARSAPIRRAPRRRARWGPPPVRARRTRRATHSISTICSRRLGPHRGCRRRSRAASRPRSSDLPAPKSALGHRSRQWVVAEHQRSAGAESAIGHRRSRARAARRAEHQRSACAESTAGMSNLPPGRPGMRPSIEDLPAPRATVGISISDRRSGRTASRTCPRPRARCNRRRNRPRAAWPASPIFRRRVVRPASATSRRRAVPLASAICPRRAIAAPASPISGTARTRRHQRSARAARSRRHQQYARAARSRRHQRSARAAWTRRHHGPADAQTGRPRRSARAPELFDDLPQPAMNRGGSGPDLPAPKGFFDDLPQPAMNRGPNLPAPKGFFDDLPQPSQTRAPELPAPKGFFENLPATKSQAQPPPSPPAAPPPFSAAGLFGREPEVSGSHALNLGDSGPELDIRAVGASDAAAADGRRWWWWWWWWRLRRISIVEAERRRRPAPLPSSRNPCRKRRKRACNTARARRRSSRSRGGHDGSLELEEPRVQTPKLAPKKKDKAPDPVAAAASGKRKKLLLGAVLGVALLGGGGFMMYQRHAAAQERRGRNRQREESPRRGARCPRATPATGCARARRRAKVQELDETNPCFARDPFQVVAPVAETCYEVRNRVHSRPQHFQICPEEEGTGESAGTARGLLSSRVPHHKCQISTPPKVCPTQTPTLSVTPSLPPRAAAARNPHRRRDPSGLESRLRGGRAGERRHLRRACPCATRRNDSAIARTLSGRQMGCERPRRGPVS